MKATKTVTIILISAALSALAGCGSTAAEKGVAEESSSTSSEASAPKDTVETADPTDASVTDLQAVIGDLKDQIQSLQDRLDAKEVANPIEAPTDDSQAIIDDLQRKIESLQERLAYAAELEAAKQAAAMQPPTEDPREGAIPDTSR